MTRTRAGIAPLLSNISSAASLSVATTSHSAPAAAATQKGDSCSSVDTNALITPAAFRLLKRLSPGLHPNSCKPIRSRRHSGTSPRLIPQQTLFLTAGFVALQVTRSVRVLGHAWLQTCRVVQFAYRCSIPAGPGIDMFWNQREGKGMYTQSTFSNVDCRHIE